MNARQHDQLYGSGNPDSIIALSEQKRHIPQPRLEPVESNETPINSYMY